MISTALVRAALAAVGIYKIWLVDFEFCSRPGGLPEPICMVAKEVNSGTTVRWGNDELRRAAGPPYGADADSVMVAFYAAAEVGCHLALGWPLPTNILDLFAEFRTRTNGLWTPDGASLLGALSYFGLPAIGADQKEAMRALALRGGPWTAEERAALLAYCETDVVALAELLPVMMPGIDLPRALHRGRYMKAVARMERTGVPVSVEDLGRLRFWWKDIPPRLIQKVDQAYGVFEERTFKRDRWRRWTEIQGIAWPELSSGAQALDADTFREMARVHPEVLDMKELRASLSQLRLADLAVGADGRNRCMLSAYRAKTSRNQPSTSKFAFGPAVWLRSIIQAPPGYALAYVDWEQQEFGIAAAFSGDPAMMFAYLSGDPYLAFAIQARAAPKGATKATHAKVRDQYKACALAVQYGMGFETLAGRIGQSEAHARRLLELHRQTYPRFWQWSDAALDYAMLTGALPTVFGWEIHVGDGANPRSLRNYPMQANGAEMLRLACSFATERGIAVCAPVHDALLVEAPINQIEEVVIATQKAMADASRLVLDGFELRSEAKIFAHPDRFTDPRGESMWAKVWEIIEELERAGGADTAPTAAPTASQSVG
jgi:DNA polymerase-1